MDSDKTSRNTDADPLSHLAHQLGERVKELNCLFGISDIVERAGGSLERILEETADLLTQSWDHSDVACARIVLGGYDVRSGACQDPVATQEATVLVHGKSAGTIQLSYVEERPHRHEGPFTKEERRLLNAVAERMGHVVERLTTEERLREKEEEFRERMTHVTRVSTMGEMASSIAHEVNQPLTAIATYAQACRRLVDGGLMDAPEVREILGKIGEEALRAGEIIRRLRHLVQKREPERVRCDVTELLREVEPLASVDARLNGVDLRFTFPEESPTILADAVQIQQVVLNLIRNGIDAMAPSSSGDKVLDVQVNVPGNDEVQVSVTDRGCGLPEEGEEELFQPFFTTKESGLGLGLSISRSIIDAHGGRLWFSRNPGGGATFHFTIPTATETHDD